MAVEKIKPGELKGRSLNLKQTDKVRKELSKAAYARYALQKIGPVSLEWKRKSR